MALRSRYRYRLTRVWNPDGPMVLFIGLNPSTADATHDDPTVRRCVRFARDWGFGGLLLGNLYAHRATRPADLAAAASPVGRGNDQALRAMAGMAGSVIVAWGNGGLGNGRDVAVLGLLERPVLCLGTTARGAPRHPLYVAAGTRPVPYRPQYR